MVGEDEEQTCWHINMKPANVPFNSLDDSLLVATSANSLAKVCRTTTSSSLAIYYVISCSTYS